MIKNALGIISLPGLSDQTYRELISRRLRVSAQALAPQAARSGRRAA